MASTNRLKRWILPIALALVLLLAIASTAVWTIACQRLEADARTLAAANGWSLEAGPARWRGWPVAAEIDLPNVALRAGPTLPPLVWTAPQARLRIALLHPTLLTATGFGQQAIGLAGAPAVPFTAKDLHVVIDLTGADPVRAEFAGLDAATPAGPVRVDAGTLGFSPGGLQADLAGIALPDGSRSIEPAIDAVRFTLRIEPPFPPAPDPSARARLWRAQNGRIEVTSAALTWAAMTATGHATLTLDPALQPVLAGEVRETGLDPTLDTLAQTGAISPTAALAAKAMLAILAAPAGAGPVTLPVALQDGVLSVARIPLLRLAPLVW